MNKLLLLFFLVVSPGILFAQDPDHTSTVTLSAGGQTYSYNSFDQHGGPAFTGRYEFRLWKYFAVETGFDTLLPETHTAEILSVILSGQNLTAYFPGCKACVIVPISERTQVRLLPFGGKAILPVANGRVELFLGLGGAYAWHSDYGRDALLGQASFGGRLALDRKRHFWLGTSVRGYTNGFSNYSYRRQSWVSWTADFGLRFGH